VEPHELPPFRGLSRADLAAALNHFELVTAEPGQPLMVEGEDDSSLVLVLDGELRISAGPLELGRAGPGEVIGETALLTADPRSATVAAAVPSRLLLLQRDDYEALRDAGSPVAAAVERYALDLVVERLLEATRKVGELSKGTALADVTPPKGWLARIRELLGTGGERARPWLDVAATLRDVGFFRGASAEALAEIAPHLRAQAWDAGTFLCTRGSLAHEMFERGDAFGINALCTGGPRTASCVARTTVVVLTLDRDGWSALIDTNSPGGSALRVAMIRRVAGQLAYANAELTQLELSNPATALGRAHAALDTHGAYLG
jgi:CRP-like cAMP-binding protein